MTVYIDPPLWPAHGTVFSHLISDTSLEELHAVAASAGIPDRAFDLDHYDVPERLRQKLVDCGAVPVTGAELTRALISSGLRVTSKQRGPHLMRELFNRWDATLPDHPEIGKELLQRWNEPHRHYHGPRHLLAVLEALDELTNSPSASDSPGNEIQLAAWFHDAVHQGATPTDEEASAELVATLLDGVLPRRALAEVQRLVLLTIAHQPEPDDDAGALLSDADLAILGSDDAAYSRYLVGVRREYPDVSGPDFVKGRTAVVRSLLANQRLFDTDRGQTLWEDKARENLSGELNRFTLAEQNQGLPG